jgi:hypothetical protein
MIMFFASRVDGDDGRGGRHFTSALCVKYRDIRHALPFAIQIWMFLTPVMWIREAKNLQCRWMLQDRASDRRRRDQLGALPTTMRIARVRPATSSAPSSSSPCFFRRTENDVRLLGGLLNRAYGQRFPALSVLMTGRLRIGVDGRVLGVRTKGLARYILELCKGLDAIIPDAEFYLYSRKPTGPAYLQSLA